MSQIFDLYLLFFVHCLVYFLRRKLNKNMKRNQEKKLPRQN